VRLALAHGLEHVTVEAIAEAADMSRRTFSNHFSSTQEAIVYGDTAWILRLIERAREQPEDHPVWTALSRSALELLPEFVRDQTPDEVRRRELRMHPDLATLRAALSYWNTHPDRAPEEILTTALAAATPAAPIA
jgi:AcrR family transcriptional regulator